MNKLLFVFVIMFVSLVHAADMYKVSTSVYENGDLIASPVVIVEENKEGIIAIDTKFVLKLVVKSVGDTSVHVSTNLDVDSNSIEPEMTMKLDEEATIKIDTYKVSILVNEDAE